MTNNPQLKQLSSESAKLVTETFRELQRVAITSEERIRQRIRSSVRIVVASALFCISGLVTLGINVTTALASKASHTSVSKVKRSKAHHRTHHRWHAISSAARVVHHGTLTLNNGQHLTGLASWYGGKFQHRKTASGTVFNTQSFTAAHRSLPFGTKVRVTNMANNQSCIVEITDRGPYVGSRIIDLSRAAATELGFISTGTAQVELEVLPVMQDISENIPNHVADNMEAANH